jgi:hypothetical protein
VFWRISVKRGRATLPGALEVSEAVASA